MLQPAQLQNLIVIILECARFNDSAIWICHNEENGFIQDGETAEESFIPEFDNEGV